MVNMSLAALLFVFGPGSLIAIIMWWRQPRFWWACLSTLATTAGVALYLPVRLAFHTPSDADGFDSLGIAVEFFAFCFFAVFVHLGCLLFMQFAVEEDVIERRKAGAAEEEK
jgi:hypothetical protein